MEEALLDERVGDWSHATELGTPVSLSLSGGCFIDFGVLMDGNWLGWFVTSVCMGVVMEGLSWFGFRFPLAARAQHSE